jgi:RNA polymerase sigma factor (TIGR02999 family)
LDSRLASLIEAAEKGDGPVTEALFEALYSERHRLAKRELARPGAQVSVSATTLLHEAYLDMAGRNGTSFPDCARFMGYAARVMRGLIIDHARNRSAIKRGGEFTLTSMDEAAEGKPADERELTRISDALNELAKIDASLAEVVDLKFFCGFSFAEIGAMHNISERTVQRKWEKARIYLHSQLRRELRSPE